MTATTLPRLAVTAGEPAGVGPELVARLAGSDLPADIVAITDRDLLRRAAAICGIDLTITDDDGSRLTARAPGHVRLRHVPLGAREVPGQPSPDNARHVIDMLGVAADGCLAGEFDAVVTGPVQKSSINEAGVPFSGHTEFFAERSASDVVMMLASPDLRVTLATTHLPLSAVPQAVTAELLERTLRIVSGSLASLYGIVRPRIAVLGLNPHAGEGGHMGREEITTIIPLLERLRGEGMDLLGPLPADTAFVPAMRGRYDVVLAMYHDQALPVLKSEAFDSTVNVTLGLPFIRTSVDHGTALDLAGTGSADPASLFAATRLAIDFANNRAAAV